MDKPINKKGRVIIIAMSVLMVANAAYIFGYDFYITRFFPTIPFAILLATAVAVLSYYFGTLWAKIALVVWSAYVAATNAVTWVTILMGAYATIYTRLFTAVQILIHIFAVYVILVDRNAKEFARRQSDYFDIK
jgi:predicted neutral ceramidase superfamily lipid hydrolase